MKCTKKDVRSIVSKLHTGYLNKVAALSLGFSGLLMNSVFANKTGISSYTGKSLGDDFKLPWDAFLGSVVKAMTGPFALTIGILALAGAAFALFKGNGGPATEKIILVCIGVAIVFFAPTIIGYVSNSANGLLIAATL